MLREMSLLDKLEKRFGFLAVPGLIRIVAGFTALVFLLSLDPNFYSMLDLRPALVRRGEVWRLVTYIFLPPGNLAQQFGWLWAVLAVWFLWFIGGGLERAWGAFRVTLYFIVGMVGTTSAAFLFGIGLSNSVLIASLFFAFAYFYPEEVIYLIILPLRVKWVAWISAAYWLLGFVGGPNAYRLALLFAFGNYLIFFGPGFFSKAKHRREVSVRRKKFDDLSRSDAEPLHKCAVCGRTELTDPDLEFRVARNGEEYCMDHLPSAQPAPR
jgi:membrane associated rhomboid family serine protease